MLIDISPVLAVRDLDVCIDCDLLWVLCLVVVALCISNCTVIVPPVAHVGHSYGLHSSIHEFYGDTSLKQNFRAAVSVTY